MKKVELSPIEKHKIMEGLMAAIFGKESASPLLPLCYPYIITEEEKILSLDEAIEQTLASLPSSKGKGDLQPWPRLKGAS